MNLEMNPEIVIVNVNRDSVTIDKFGVNKGFEVMSINRVQRSRAADRKNIYQRLRSEEHTSELQSHSDLVCRLLLEKKNNNYTFKWQ